MCYCLRSEAWPRHGRTFSIYLCLSDWLFHEESCPCIELPVQAMRGLPRLRAPGIISFSLQATPLFMVWTWYASFLVLTVSNSSLFTPALLSTYVNVLLFCSLAVLNPRVGHTMDALSPFISVFCLSDRLFYGESCPCIDIVRPGHAWSSALRAPGIISLSRQLPCFLMVWP